MRGITIAAILLSVCSGAFSQTKTENLLRLSAGPSIPLQPYSGKDFSDQNAGFASPGVSLSVDFLHSLSASWSITAGVTAQLNPINKKAFEEEIGAYPTYSSSIFGPSLYPPYISRAYVVYPNWKVERRSWKLAALNLGFERKITKAEKSWIAIGAGGGLVYASFPGFAGKSISDSSSANINIESSHALGLSYGANASYNRALSAQLFISGRVSFAGTSRLRFKEVHSSLSSQENFPSTGGNFEYNETNNSDQFQVANSLLIQLGIGFRL